MSSCPDPIVAWHSADGAECTNNRPLVPGPFGRVAERAVTVTSFISGASYAFPSGLVRR